MNVNLKKIIINRPAVKINNELKVIYKPEPPEKKFADAGNAIPCIILPALIGFIGNATAVPEE